MNFFFLHGILYFFFYFSTFTKLAGVAPEKAIKLTVNDMLRREFKSWNEAAGDDSISIPLEILAGGGGGMVSCYFPT